MTRILILKTGTTFPEIARDLGDFDILFKRAMQIDGVSFVVSDVSNGEPLPDFADGDGVVVTGSPAMVTDRADWSEATAAWLAEWVSWGRPALGVCYGHQLLAHALGGKVGGHADGREMGTLDVTLTDRAADDPLFGGLPASFPAHLTHRQSVIALPDGATLLARSESEPHQAFRVGTTAWGLQFHPEFTEQVMAAYIDRQRMDLLAEGRNPDMMRDQLKPTRDATSLLPRFVQGVKYGFPRVSSEQMLKG